MMRRTLLLVALLTQVCIGSGSGAATTDSQSSDNDVIVTERRALERWVKGDPDGFLETYADDVTYFDPLQDHRIDGRPAMTALLAPVRGNRPKLPIRFEMLNPKVQQLGDIAVLTYNVVNYEMRPDGTEHPTTRWNSTAVFRRTGGKWRTIHSHWSFTKPALKP